MAKIKVTKILKIKSGECPPEVVCAINSITNEVVDPATLIQCPETIYDFSGGCVELTAEVEGVGVLGDCVSAQICRAIEIDCVTDAKTITTTLLIGDLDVTENAVVTECPTYMVMDSQEVCIAEAGEGEVAEDPCEGVVCEGGFSCVDGECVENVSLPEGITALTDLTMRFSGFCLSCFFGNQISSVTITHSGGTTQLYNGIDGVEISECEVTWDADFFGINISTITAVSRPACVDAP